MRQDLFNAALEALIEATAQQMRGGPAPGRALILPSQAYGCSLSHGDEAPIAQVDRHAVSAFPRPRSREW